MTKYKSLITDLDGTAIKLAGDQGDVTQESQTAIQRAKEQGYKIACATGRRWSSTKKIVDTLGITDPCIIEGGTRIINPTNEETLWEKHLDVTALAAVLDIFQRESNEGLLNTLSFNRKDLHSVSKVANDSRYMYLLDIDSEVAINICNVINSQAFAVAHMTPSWFGHGKLDVHVTHPEATKEHAIVVWQRIEGISKEETIGMGDGGNDIPLFESVGLKVAVSNATVELKRLADYIAPDQKDEALAHIIDRFLLGQ
jgi:HAD superfamily hydrolase (TIGR01484 family)